MVVVGERLGLRTDGVTVRGRTDGIVVSVTEADGDAVADSTRLTSTASSLTPAGSQRGGDVIVSVTAAVEPRLTAASCTPGAFVTSWRRRGRRGGRLRLRTDGVRGPDGVVVGVTEADADSIVAHTHRQSPRRDVDVIVMQTRVRSRRAGVAVVVVGEMLGLTADGVTETVAGLTVSSWVSLMQPKTPSP